MPAAHTPGYFPISMFLQSSRSATPRGFPTVPLQCRAHESAYNEYPGSKCCTNCCTNPPPERPKTPRNAPEPPIFHNNIHKAESFRNRPVGGSGPIVGSRFPVVYRQSVHHLLHNCSTLARQPYLKWGKQQDARGQRNSIPCCYTIQRLHLQEGVPWTFKTYCR